MWRFTKFLAVVFLGIVVGFWAGYNIKASENKRLKDELSAVSSAAEEAKRKVMSVEKENSKILTDIQKATGQAAENAAKALSRDELGDRLIVLGTKLKSGSSTQ